MSPRSSRLSEFSIPVIVLGVLRHQTKRATTTVRRRFSDAKTTSSEHCCYYRAYAARTGVEVGSTNQRTRIRSTGTSTAVDHRRKQGVHAERPLFPRSTKLAP